MSRQLQLGGVNLKHKHLHLNRITRNRNAKLDGLLLFCQEHDDLFVRYSEDGKSFVITNLVTKGQATVVSRKPFSMVDTLKELGVMP